MLQVSPFPAVRVCARAPVLPDAWISTSLSVRSQMLPAVSAAKSGAFSPLTACPFPFSSPENVAMLVHAVWERSISFIRINFPSAFSAIAASSSAFVIEINSSSGWNSLSLSDSLSVWDSLSDSDSLSVWDSLSLSDSLSVWDSLSLSDSLPVWDSLSLSYSLSA